jgi:hypothetical protein
VPEDVPRSQRLGRFFFASRRSFSFLTILK